jgi:hypothetical protein
MNFTEYLNEIDKSHSMVMVNDKRAFLPVEKITEKYRGANLWVMKLSWDSTIRIPYDYRPLKSMGIYLNSLFHLCERTHSLTKDTGYKNASQWFVHCLHELCLIEIDDCVNARIEKLERSWSKGFVDKESKQLAMMRGYENPYTDKKCKALETLIDRAIDLTSKSTVFEKLWKQYLKDYRCYINDLKNNKLIKHAFIENDVYTVQVKGGKSLANKRKIAKII